MVAATDTMGTSAEYAYDGEGRRVKKTVNGVETKFVYDAQGRLAAEYGGSSSAPCSTCYLTADHLGSTRLVTNPSGTVVKRYDYLPFGEEIPGEMFSRGTVYSSGSYPAQPDTVASLKFTGKERDAESSLDYFIARYYSAAQGRFTSPDEFTGGIVDAYTGGQVQQPGPLPYADITDPQTLNKYAYVRNNPLRYVDPDGHCFWDLCVVEGTGVYIAAGAATAAAGYLATPQGQDATRRFIESGLTLINKAADGIRDLVSPPPSTLTDTQIQTSQDASTLQPGPHAGDSIPARGPQRDFTPGERGQVNDIGNTTGCHTCGTTTPGTKSGNFVPDHQPPSAANTNNAPQRLYPQCLKLQPPTGR